MRRGTKLFLALFVLLFLVFSAAAAVSLWWVMRPQVEEGSLLVIDLSKTLVEQRQEDGLATLMGESSQSVAQVVGGILSAAEDDRIEGLVLLNRGGAYLDLAKAWEIRQALDVFRGAGKPSHAYLEGGGNLDYYVASACENVYLMPLTELWTTGFFVAVPYMKGTLDKLHIEPEFFAYHEYKSAADTFRFEDMPEADRRQWNALLDNWWSHLVDGISASRGLERGEVEEALDASPLMPAEALERGLVDALLYWDEAKDRLDGVPDGESDAHFTWLGSYGRGLGSKSGKKIAVVYAVGVIVPGESEESLFGPSVLGSATVARAIRQAREDDSVSALVLRVDSPGGSASASDEIWREVRRTREAGKPIVVSMSWVAASGGYWISMAADKIVADPTTITGSIGVVSGKFDWSGFYEWIGMNHVHLQRGRNAGMLTDTMDFTDSQEERMRALMDFIYDEFIRKVADGRGLSEETVREIAKGRVWSGVDALEVGLVDELGGLRRSIEVAKELAGIPADEDVRLRALPRKKGFWETLMDGSKPQLGGAETPLPQPMRDALHRARVWEEWADDPVLALDPRLWGLRTGD